MGRKLDNVANDQKEMFEKSKYKVQQYQNEIDLREQEIMGLKKTNEQQTDDIKMFELKQTQLNNQMQDIEEELELKSGENNRLRTQVADLEKAVKDLYGSRKGEGSIQVELNNMKADNDKLIGLLKATSEYQDLENVDIMKKAKYLASQDVDGVCTSFGIQTNKAKARQLAKKDGDANEWIPTEAVKVIKKIQTDF